MAVETENLIKRFEDNVGQAVLGKHELVRLCLVTLLAGEHLLLEDVPGVGKTLIGKALAKSVSGQFRRMQFTPDLLPADITGSNLFDSRQQDFVFAPGPVFGNIVLADEINRTTPRTQSALLEAMSEGQVSIEGQTHQLPRPFMVIATQNPLEFEGTYPLPEAQLDRFLMRISVGYPDRPHELQVLTGHRLGQPVDRLEAVLSGEQVLELQQAVRHVEVDSSINTYLLDIVDSTRRSEDLHVGVSIRGSLALYRASQAAALVEGRTYVVPDDVKRLAVPVLAHRILTKGYLHGSNRQSVESLVGRLVNEIPVPG